MISKSRRSLFTLALLLLAVFICSFLAYNNVLADDNKKISIQCAASEPCLNGICIGNSCLPMKHYEYGSYALPNIKKSSDIVDASKDIEHVRSTVNFSSMYQDTNHDDICTNSPILTITDNAGEKSSVNTDITKIMDENLNTKWSLKGAGSYLQMDLGQIKKICSIDISWYKGDKGTYHFVISTSLDGVAFTNILKGTSDGTSISPEKYPIVKDIQGRYIRLAASRNSDMSGVSEVGIYTSSAKSINLSTTQSYQHMVSLGNPLQVTNRSQQISPSQYIELISPLLETNHSPVVSDKNVEVTSSVSALQISLAGKDIDKTDIIKFSIVDLPSHGILKQGSTPNSVTYTPMAGFTGMDSFTYDAIDNHGGESVKGRVNILISDKYPL